MARYLLAILMLAIMAPPAFAQKKGNNDDTPLAIEAREKKKEAEAIDKQYDATLKRLNKDDAPVRTDPWQNMRGTDDTKKKQ